VIAVAERASASFLPEPASARAARRFLREFLDERGHGGIADACQLALSEVVTNAVLHAHTSFEVTLVLLGDRSLRVEVADRNPQLPLQRAYALEATTGRGMDLVAAVTTDCGVDSRGPDGKTVWFVVRDSDDGSERAVDDLVAAWDIDAPSSPEPAARGTVAVLLLGLPPMLWLAAREHHDAILRELALHGQQHPDDAPPPELIAQADRSRGVISARVVAELDRLSSSAADPPRSLPSSLPATPPGMDLEVHVPGDAVEAFAALQDVLDVAERLAASGRLFARPALPEIVAVRDWACEQVIAQVAGVAPSRWPGTGQERFANDRGGVRPLDWDTTAITGSPRGAVAADDANRIIAVSRPLADALGWAVDDLVGRRVIALVPPELREAHVAGFTRHLTTGLTHILGVPLRLPVLRADGSRVDCDFLIEQSPDATGRPVYVAWISPVV
jgi:PAS domain S-box-containing protein